MFSAVYNTFPPEVWIAFGAPLIVVVVNQLKKLLGDKKMDVTIHVLTVTTSFLVTYLPTVLAHATKPPEFLAAYTAAFFTAANILYAVSKAVRSFLVYYKSKEPVQVEQTVEPTVKVVTVKTDPTPATDDLSF